uniref:Uncharacterized protein n=1 Tax=Arundo donax TaxID=35708 RepID=A0A0A8YM80_ARUDO
MARSSSVPRKRAAPGCEPGSDEGRTHVEGIGGQQAWSGRAHSSGGWRRRTAS